MCLEKYNTSLDELRVAVPGPWECFGCRNACLCTQCRRRGKSAAAPIEQPIHPKLALSHLIMTGGEEAGRASGAHTPSPASPLAAPPP